MCYAFNIDKIASVVFVIKRCICVSEIINFSQSVLKIPAKNYAGRINLAIFSYTQIPTLPLLI